MRSLTLPAPALALLAAVGIAAPAATASTGRVESQARIAMRGVDRGAARIDDGDLARATAQFAAVRRHLAAAQRTLLRRLDDDAAPDEAAVVLDAETTIAGDLSGLFDEQDPAATAVLARTLDAVLDRRAALVEALTALDDDAIGAFSDVLDEAQGAIDDELSAYDDAVTDDTLDEAAGAAVEAAQTAAGKARAAIGDRLALLGDGAPEDEDVPDETDQPDAGPAPDRPDPFGPPLGRR